MTKVHQRKVRFKRAKAGRLTTNEMSRNLQCNYKTVVREIKILQIRPAAKIKYGHQTCRLYRPSAQDRIARHLADLDELHHTCYTVFELAELVERPHSWVRRELARQKIEAIMVPPRYGNYSGQLFAAEALAALKAVAHAYTPAGDWLTREAIRKQVDKSVYWLDLHLPATTAVKQAEYRLDDSSVPRLHYPPEIVDELKLLLTCYSAKQLARLTRRSDDWVKRTLRHLRAKPRFVVKSTQTYRYYTPKIGERLLAEARRYPPAGDWVTIPQIMERMGWKRGKTVSRLRQIGAVSELRRIPKGKVADHYDPAVFDQLEVVAQAA